jgi:hypothetical protein
VGVRAVGLLVGVGVRVGVTVAPAGTISKLAESGIEMNPLVTEMRTTTRTLVRVRGGCMIKVVTPRRFVARMPYDAL